MSISTTDKPEDKRERLKKLREFHQPMLDAIGAPNASFVPKMAYRPYGKTDVHIAFFASEINKGEDVYVEFTSKELVPEDAERRLYKWRFNPHFEEEYEKTEANPQTGHVRYLVPIDELILVKMPEKKEALIPDQVDLNITVDPDQDQPMEQMTIRDYAAIHMKLPVSRKPWLNEIIINHK
jgi:hypothetical protein